MGTGTCDDGEDVEYVTSKALKCAHVSFQSTSSCNISTVNYLNCCKTSSMIRARGQFDNRRYWGIDMIKARQNYLVNYSCINSIDHLIKNFRMKCRCWKYWHSSMIHEMSLGVDVTLRNAPWIGGRIYWRDMKGRQNFWILDILWSTFQSDAQVKPNPPQIFRWSHHDNFCTA